MRWCGDCRGASWCNCFDLFQLLRSSLLWGKVYVLSYIISSTIFILLLDWPLWVPAKSRMTMLNFLSNTSPYKNGWVRCCVLIRYTWFFTFVLIVWCQRLSLESFSFPSKEISLSLFRCCTLKKCSVTYMGHPHVGFLATNDRPTFDFCCGAFVAVSLQNRPSYTNYIRL